MYVCYIKLNIYECTHIYTHTYAYTHTYIPHCLFSIPLIRDQVQRLHMSEVDFVAQDVDVEHFPHVFPFLIRGELASFLEMLADVCHFLVYALSLVLFVIAIPNISYKLR